MGKSRLYEEDVLVIGLGRFGAAAAAELHRLGHHVTAVEKNHDLAELYSQKLGRVVREDATLPLAVAAIRMRNYSLAVVGVGAIEASLLCCGNLIDAGVRSIWAKAVSNEHARLLDRIGVHHVIRPEAESGRRVAHLVNGRLLDYIEFDDGYAIVKMIPPRETIGFTVGQSQVRSKYGVTVVGVKSPGEDFKHAVPETKVSAADTLIVSGPAELIERLASRP